MKIEDEVKSSQKELENLIKVMKSSGVKHLCDKPEEKTKEMLMKNQVDSKYDSIFDGNVF